METSTRGEALLARLSADDWGLRGRLQADADMSKLTWFRVGGPADLLFQPADEDDLSLFLSRLPRDVPVTVVGVGSNLLVRDGGIAGVVIRLSARGFGSVERVCETRLKAGAAVLDKKLAAAALEAGLGGFAFYHGIPGAIGGAIRMNAGCYGSYLADVFVSATAVTRAGKVVTLKPHDMGFAYRHSDLPDDLVIVQAVLNPAAGDPAMIEDKMAALDKDRFERILRGIFEEDEIILILVGGVLGAGVGFLQALLVLAVQ